MPLCGIIKGSNLFKSSSDYLCHSRESGNPEGNEQKTGFPIRSGMTSYLEANNVPSPLNPLPPGERKFNFLRKIYLFTHLGVFLNDIVYAVVKDTYCLVNSAYGLLLIEAR